MSIFIRPPQTVGRCHYTTIGGGDGGGGIGIGIGGGSPTPSDTDCERLADIVENLANNAKSAKNFLDKMVARFIGKNFDVNSRSDFDTANRTGNSEFGSSGFKSEFVDSSNQVRHFTGGVWAGYLYGSALGNLGMNSNEDSTVSGRGIIRSGFGAIPTFFPSAGAKADIALNAVSTTLGANLTPKKALHSRKEGYSTPANPGYKGLAKAIRDKVCK